MTPEELEILVLESPGGTALQKAFAPLDAAQRKKLSTAANKLYTQISRNQPNKDASDRLKWSLGKRSGKEWTHWSGNPHRHAILALYALCPISTLKRRDLFVGWDESDVLGQIILDRRPDWLDEWVDYDLEQDFPVIEFSMLRRWIKAGACRKPDGDGYTVMFASYMMAPARRDDSARPPLSKQLLAEPDLLDDVWALFRVESVAFNTNPWLTNNAPADYESWTDALLKLAASGDLDRRRLLDASLEGLSLDLKQNQLSGFHKFHKALAPAKEELSARQSEYLGLLTHKVGHVCKFSLDRLAQLEKDGNLDCQTFLGEVQAVFFQEGKGNAVAALKLIQRVIKKRPELLGDGLRAVTEALRNANADVQEQAISILESHGAGLDEDLRSAIQRGADFVSVSMRSSLASLLGEEKTSGNGTGTPDAQEGEAIETAVAALSSSKSRALGIGEILSKESFEYLPISNNILHHAILPTVEPIEAIQTVDELIALVSHAVEIVETPDEIERIIDGVSRLGGDRSKDFAAKVAPLLHRIEQGGSEGSKGILGYGGLKYALSDLLLTWLTSDLYKTPTDKHTEPEGSFEPAIAHLRAITRRLAAGQSAPLLSTPSHSGAWIEPSEWVRRLLEAEKSGCRFDSIDFCRSVLRLMPDNRSAALKESRALSGDYARPAIFALGGEATLSLSDRQNYDLWISAARARDPGVDWSDLLAPLKIIDPWPDSSRPAQRAWRAYIEDSQPFPGGEVYKIPRLDITVGTDAALTAPESTDGLLQKIGKAITSQLTTDWKKLPAAALNQRKERKYFWSGDLTTTWIAQWLPYQWPLCPNGAYMTGATALMGRIDEDSSNWTPGFGYLTALFQKNRPWLEPGHLCLCLGLTGKDADSRGLAIDAMIEGIEAGQLDTKLFAGVLSDLSKGGWLKLNRLGDNLMQVVQTSPLHAWVVSECLQPWLAETDLKQRNIFCVLEVLLEAQAAAGQRLNDDLRQALGSQKGSSKAAKLAGKILEVSDHTASAGEAVRHLAIASRLNAA